MGSSIREHWLIGEELSKQTETFVYKENLKNFREKLKLIFLNTCDK